MPLLCYLDGTEAMVGDIVTLQGERSTVETIIDKTEAKVWGMEKPEILLQNKTFGRIYIDYDDFEGQEVVFISRSSN